MKMKRLTAYLCALAVAATAMAQTYQTSSVLASGRWVKIAVDSTGMHQLTPQQLTDMGFSDPSKVTVWGAGGTMYENPDIAAANVSDDLAQTPSMTTSDGRVLFYGQGRVRARVDSPTKATLVKNNYSRRGYYFVTDSRPSMTVPSYQAPDASAQVDTKAIVVEYYDPEKQNIASAGGDFYDEPFTPERPYSFSFPLAQYAGGDVSLGYQIAANVDQRTRMLATVTDGAFTVLSYSSPYLWKGLDSDYRNYKVLSCSAALQRDDTQPLTDGLKVQIGMDVSGTATYLAADHMWALYEGNAAVGATGQSILHQLASGRGQLMSVGNADADARVWDVTSGTICPVGDYDAATRTLRAYYPSVAASPAPAANTYVAFNPSAQMLPVSIVGEVAPQNLHGLAQAPRLLIITTDPLEEAAQELAEIHRAHGQTVEVATQGKIFNEFSSGTPHAMAYRRLASMLSQRGSDLKYVLLYGAGLWDNREITITAPSEMLLTYQVEDPNYVGSWVYTPAYDLYFGILTPSLKDIAEVPNTNPDLSVGRIPAGDPAEARAVNRKIQRYLDNPMTPAQASRAVLMSDAGDNNAHLQQGEDQAAEILKAAPYATVLKAHNLLYPLLNGQADRARNLAIQSLKEGVRYFSYCGHGSNTGLSGAQMWNISYINSTSYDMPPIVLLSSCNSLVYDHMDPGLGVRMCLKEDGGSIGMVGTNRSVILSYNAYVSTGLAREVFGAAPGSSIGDAYLAMRRYIIDHYSSKDVQYNTMNYNLCGDPSLPIYAPALKPAITAIDSDPGFVTPYEVQPLRQFTLEGQLNATNGQIDPEFNGTATLEVYDGPFSINSRKEGSSGTTLSLALDEAKLAQVTVPVANGVFTAPITLPLGQHPGVGNRVLITAISQDKDKSAAGAFDGLVVADVEQLDAPSGGSAPSITAYIGSPDFVDGQQVESSFVYHADITADACGLNLATKGVGNGVELTIDGGSTTFPTVPGTLRTLPDGTYAIDYAMSDVTDGRHTISLSVADNAGRRASHTLAFTVDRTASQPSVTLVSDVPARAEAVLVIVTPDNAGDTRLIIEDPLGRVVRIVDNVPSTYQWDLRDTDGNLVADGLYRARVLTARAGSARADVMVIKPTR